MAPKLVCQRLGMGWMDQCRVTMKIVVQTVLTCTCGDKIVYQTQHMSLFLLKGNSHTFPFVLCSILRGCLKRSARAVQLFGRLAVVEAHTLWYFGHPCCLVVGFDALGIWHFWMFTLFHPFLLFCTHFLPISTTSTLFLG